MVTRDGIPVDDSLVKPNHTHERTLITHLNWSRQGTLGLWLTDGCCRGFLTNLCVCLREKRSSSREKMPLKASVSLFVLMCVCCVEECVCFPNGSVAFSCGNMMPVHPPFTPSTSSPPFKLSTSSATYRPGGLITVTVEVVRNSSTQFQGFLLQARSRDGQALLWPVGKFTNIDSTQFTALHCQNMENSTVSQASGARKQKVQLTWEAPSNSHYREIYFSATLVQDYTTFWVQLNSSSLRLDSSGNPAAGVSSALIFISLLSISAYC
ncbi:putative defense protein 1 [Trachinotus anak]|uniref:putative defense protein 1 n=1 Tax=Trachinotus anak TaxID=443729 RepID=UPI0039F21193